MNRAGGRRPAILVLLAAAATLAVGALMALQGARSGALPVAQLEGFIVRFELARSVGEVAALLGPADTPEGQRLRAMLNLVNTTDCAFAVAYPLLNAAMVAFLAAGRRAWIAVGAALALAMTVGDVLENQALIALASGAPTEALVARLQAATSVKWSAVYLCAALLGLQLLLSRGPRRLLAILGFGGALLGLFAVLWPVSPAFDPRTLAGRASSTVTLLWVGILVLAARRLLGRDRGEAAARA